MKPRRRNNEFAEMAHASPRSHSDRSREHSDMDNPRENSMAFAIAKRPTALAGRRSACARRRRGERRAPRQGLRQGRQIRHRLLAGQQRRALPSARQRRTDRGGQEGPAIHAPDRRRRRQREYADLADGQFHHPEGRSDPDLAVRGRAAHPGRRAGDEGGHSGDRARPQDGRRPRQGLHRLHRRRQFQDRRGGRELYRREAAPRRRRGRRARGTAELRPLRSSGSTASRTASRPTRRSRSSPSRPPTGCRTKPRPPSPRCCRPIPTSKRSTPATT